MVFDRVENIVGKGEIACTSNFSFSHNVFKRLLFQTRQKVSLCGNGLNESWKMLLGKPLASLITFFRTSLIKFYHNSQRMSGSFYHITESSELNSEYLTRMRRKALKKSRLFNA